MADEIEVVEYEIPLLWGCYIAIGGLLMFALAIVVVIIFFFM